MRERDPREGLSRRALLLGGMGSLLAVGAACGSSRASGTDTIDGPFQKAVRVPAGAGPGVPPSGAHGFSINAANTGPRVAPATVINGDYRLGPGTYERLEVRGSLEFAGGGPIVVRDLIVRPQGSPVYGLVFESGSNVTIEFMELDGRAGRGLWAGTNLSSNARWTIRRSRFHHIPTAVFLGTGQAIEECFINDLGSTDGSAHLECVKTNGTGTRGGRIVRSHLHANVASGFGGGLTAAFQIEDPAYEVVDNYLWSEWYCGGFEGGASGGLATGNILDPITKRHYWYGGALGSVSLSGNITIEGQPING